MKNEKVHFFEGTSFDIGCSHGELIVDRFEDILADLYSSELWTLTKRKFPHNILDTFKSLYLILCLKSSLKKEKLAKEYLKGVMSIHGMSQKKMYTLLLTEVLGGDKNRHAYTMGCSALIKKIDDKITIAKNFDYQYCLNNSQGFIIRKQLDLYSYLSISPMLMPFGGQFCMNQKGLTVSYNYCYTKKGIAYKGLPPSYIVHKVISECKNCDEAIKVIKNRKFPVSIGASFALADSKSKYIVELEGKSTKVITGEMITHTNHFQSDELKENNFSDDDYYNINHESFRNTKINESSNKRLTKLKQCIDDIKSIEKLKTVFSEEKDSNGLNNIFQSCEFWGTISTCIGVPEELKVIFYADVRNNIKKEFDLNELFN